MAEHLVEIGLSPGERILIVTAARIACVVMAAGALSAGLEPLLVPIGTESTELAAIARATGCVGIVGGTSYGGLQVEETLFEAALRSETIRCVGTLGPGQVDGAVDLMPERLSWREAKVPTTLATRPRLGTLDAQRVPIFHDQSALLAAALEFVGKAEIAADSHLLSTLAPASFASLVTGPVASLLSGAPLTLFGPFAAASFVELLDATEHSHCVIPAAVLPDFARAGLLREGVFASVIALMADEAIPAIAGDCPIIEVYGAGDGAIRIESQARANATRLPILSGEVLAPVPPARQAERSWR